MRSLAAALGTLAAGALLAAGSAGETASRGAPSGPGGCELLPSTDALKQDISGLDEAGNSDQVIDRILADGGSSLHPDFGSNPRYGIPFEVVGAGQKRVPVRIRAYPHQSDKGPHPIPRDARIEGGKRSNGDRHVLVVERDGPDAGGGCRLIELFRAFYAGGPKSAGGQTSRASSTSAKTFRSAPTGGHRPTLPASRSSPDWCATRRSRPATSITRSG